MTTGQIFWPIVYFEIELLHVEFACRPCDKILIGIVHCKLL